MNLLEELLHAHSCIAAVLAFWFFCSATCWFVLGVSASVVTFWSELESARFSAVAVGSLVCEGVFNWTCRFSFKRVKIWFLFAFGNYLHMCFSSFLDFHQVVGLKVSSLPSAITSLRTLSDATPNTSVSQRVLFLAAGSYSPSSVNSFALVTNSSSGLSPGVGI